MIVKHIIVGEDIRGEVGNKLSLMGILGDTLTINLDSPPPHDSMGTIVSLALLVILERTADDADQEEVKVQVAAIMGDIHLINLVAKLPLANIGKMMHLPVNRFDIAVATSSQVVINAQIFQNGVLSSKATSRLNININSPA